VVASRKASAYGSQVSFRVFLTHAIDTYVTMCKDDEPEVDQFWRMLRYLFTRGLKRAEASEVKSCLRALWQPHSTSEGIPMGIS
jgi:hypothetical protein